VLLNEQRQANLGQLPPLFLENLVFPAKVINIDHSVLPNTCKIAETVQGGKSRRKNLRHQQGWQGYFWSVLPSRRAPSLSVSIRRNAISARHLPHLRRRFRSSTRITASPQLL
jgi:hypothetical protein